MDVYGPGAERGEFRGVRALVFAYTEFDLTRTLSEAWSVTGSYTHEWVPKMSNWVWVPQRYTRDEHLLAVLFLLRNGFFITDALLIARCSQKNSKAQRSDCLK